MSYRELRDFAEILRTLGFPRLVSIENFRLPNFLLMAEILEWIVLKFDFNLRIAKNIDTETDRVIFVKSCVLILIQKGQMCLNPINLYQSDGHAVREFLIILRKLYQTTKNKQSIFNINNLNKTSDQLSNLRTKFNLIRQELHFLSSLALDIPQKAANIYDLLSKELLTKELRIKVLSKHLNPLDIEKEINELIKKVAQKILKTEHNLSNIANDERDLEQKIERRNRELNHLQKRLIKLQAYQPSYMDKYKEYENQLKNSYNTYVVLFRNLSYLQLHLTELEKAERQHLEVAEQNTRLAADKLRIDNNIYISSKLQDLDTKKNSNTFQKTREIRFVGNMVGAGMSDDDDDVEDEEIDKSDLKNVDTQNDVTSEESKTNAESDSENDEYNLTNKLDYKESKSNALEAIIENEDDENLFQDFNNYF